jgi:hypothetical protein
MRTVEQGFWSADYSGICLPVNENTQQNKLIASRARPYEREYSKHQPMRDAHDNSQSALTNFGTKIDKTGNAGV